MELRDLFDEAFFNYGFLYEPVGNDEYAVLASDAFNILKDVHNQVEDKLIKIPDGNVVHGLLHGEGINAKITKHKGKYYIAARSESMHILKFIFGLMFSNPKMFTELGDVTKEQVLPKLEYVKLTSVSKIEKIWAGGVESWPVPIDQKRYTLMRYCMQTAFRYICLHEYGHFLNGHLEFLENGNLKFSELSKQQAQALELDADKFAGTSIFEYVKNGILKQLQETPEIAEFIVEDELEMLLWTYISVYTLIRLYTNGEVNESEILSQNHPVQIMRETSLRDDLYLIYKDREDIRYRLPELVMQAIKQVEMFFLMIWPDHLGTGAIITSHLLEPQYFELLSYLNQFRDELKMHSFVDKPEYDGFEKSIRPINIMSNENIATVKWIKDKDGKEVFTIVPTPYQKRKIELSERKEKGDFEPNSLCNCGSALPFKKCHGEGLF